MPVDLDKLEAILSDCAVRLADQAENTYDREAGRKLRNAAPSLIAELREARRALIPFADFGRSDDGVLKPEDLMRDRVCDWFGVSDFYAARDASFLDKPTETKP